MVEAHLGDVRGGAATEDLVEAALQHAARDAGVLRDVAHLNRTADVFADVPERGDEAPVGDGHGVGGLARDDADGRDVDRRARGGAAAHQAIEHGGSFEAHLAARGLHAGHGHGRELAEEFVLGTVEDGDFLRHAQAGVKTRVDDLAPTVPCEKRDRLWAARSATRRVLPP